MPERAPPGRLRRLLPELLRDAGAQLRAHAAGHALTLVGIVWGAAAVVLLLSLGTGFNRFLDLGIEKTGARFTQLDDAYTTAESGGRRPGRRVALTTRDIERIRAGAPTAAFVSGEIQRAVPAATPRRTRATIVSACEPDAQLVRRHRVARGRFFDARDEAAGRRVAVIGSNLAGVFFGGADPLGRSLQLDGTPFDVIGVLERKGFQLMINNDLHDNMVFIPLSAGRRLFDTGREVGHIFVEPRRLRDAPRLRAELRAALWPLHHLSEAEREAIRFDSVPEIMQPTRNIFVALQVLLGAIGTVTLAMAGVGVANRMVAVVNTRRAELAVRRACGARGRDVVLQLLLETLVVVLAGGALGAGLGAGAALAIAALPLPPDLPRPLLVPSAIATSFLVLVAVGVAAGLLPARAASRVEPSTALRIT